MPSYEPEFEAMMADSTSPPLSLGEFRLFVAHDPKARNALAFCEWYQRYRTVYFDCVSVARSTASSPAKRRLGIPGILIPPVSCSQSTYDPATRNDLSWKSHGTSVLSESAAGSATHTINASAGHRSDRWPARSLGRRCTLPAIAAVAAVPDTEREHRAQEGNRAAIQSLLVFECWARFLCGSALEPVEIPDAEALYIAERLPLNITHLPQPLLCRGDMLAPRSPAASHAHPTAASSRGTKDSVPTRPRLTDADAHASHARSPSLPAAHAICAASALCCNPAPVGLRRVSTMPVPLRGTTTQSHRRLPTFSHVSPPPLLVPLPTTQATQLLAVARLRRLHHTLRPQPPLDAGPQFQPLCGYKPVPDQVSKLIVPNNVPPALFETTAKVSANYLLQHYFADFYSQAHRNLSAAEQRLGMAVALGLLVLGIGTAITLALACSHAAWRLLAMPLFVAATAGLSAAWTRIAIWRWWRRVRPTSLVVRIPADAEDLLQGAAGPDTSMHAVRSVTGTLWSQRPSVLVGTFKAGARSSSCCMCSYPLAACGWCAKAASSTSVEAALPSSPSLPGATLVQRAVGRLVRFMLRRHNSGDQWHIDLDSRRYQVLEPLVLRGQCYSVGHQLAALAAAWCVAAAALAVTP